jgi:hypothetical protein
VKKEDIKKVILKATGNPESGAIKDNADRISEAIYSEFFQEEVKSFSPEKEVRVVKASETR